MNLQLLKEVAAQMAKTDRGVEGASDRLDYAVSKLDHEEAQLIEQLLDAVEDNIPPEQIEAAVGDEKLCMLLDTYFAHL